MSNLKTLFVYFFVLFYKILGIHNLFTYTYTHIQTHVQLRKQRKLRKYENFLIENCKNFQFMYHFALYCFQYENNVI